MISPKFHFHIQAERFCRHFGQNMDNRAYKLDEEVKNVVSAYIWRAMDGELNPNRDTIAVSPAVPRALTFCLATACLAT